MFSNVILKETNDKNWTDVYNGEVLLGRYVTSYVNNVSIVINDKVWVVKPLENKVFLVDYINYKYSPKWHEYEYMSELPEEYVRCEPMTDNEYYLSELLIRLCTNYLDKFALLKLIRKFELCSSNSYQMIYTVFNRTANWN